MSANARSHTQKTGKLESRLNKAYHQLRPPTVHPRMRRNPSRNHALKMFKCHLFFQRSENFVAVISLLYLTVAECKINVIYIIIGILIGKYNCKKQQVWSPFLWACNSNNVILITNLSSYVCASILFRMCSILLFLTKPLSFFFFHYSPRLMQKGKNIYPMPACPPSQRRYI